MVLVVARVENQRDARYVGERRGVGGCRALGMQQALLEAMEVKGEGHAAGSSAPSGVSFWKRRKMNIHTRHLEG